MVNELILTVLGHQYEVHEELMKIGITSSDFKLYSIPMRVPSHTTVIFKNKAAYDLYAQSLLKERIVE